MTLLQTTFYSDSLRMDTRLNILVPQNCARTPEHLRDRLKPPYRVLYLLHGLSSNEEGWMRFTSIERYVRDLDLVVVMPTTHRGFYVNNRQGYPYSDYLSLELPAFIQELLPVSTEREDTYIAGASMGGYGAMKAAFTYPGKYGYVASLSGVMDISTRYEDGPDPESPFEHQMIFGGENPKGTDLDIYHLVDQALAGGQPLPKVYLNCGTSDYLYEQNVDFYKHFHKDLDLTFFEEPGDHGWPYWDRNIQRILDWLPTIANENE